MTQRFHITIEYDGGPFVGWQAQENGPSVQVAIEDAIAGFSGEKVRIFGAGRTDAGVHALGQAAHFDLAKDMTADKVREALNAHLRPGPVVVLAVKVVSNEFDARFSAIKRHYLYRITNRRPPLALEKERAWHVIADLNAGAMHKAAQELVGRHDFTTFRSVRCQAKSPEKTLDRLDVSRDGDEITVIASARSFLHHQVRSMVGTLKLVGEGKWSADDVAAALAACDRQKLRLNAPPHGLYLTGVDYPED